MTHGGGASEVPSVYGDDDQGHGVVGIAVVAALAGFLFGYDSAVINGAVDAISDRFSITGYPLGLVVASALLGAALGAVTAGRLADHLGRLSVMKIAAVMFFISAIGTGLAPSLWLLVTFRVVGGIGVGLASVIAPAYIAEVSPGAHPRASRLAAAVGHRGRHLRLPAGQLRAAAHRRRGVQRPVVRHRGVALDVPGHGGPGRRVRRPVVHHPGISALPDRQ